MHRQQNIKFVNQVFTLKNTVLNVLQYITFFLPLSKNFRGDDVKSSRVKTLKKNWRP